MSNEARKIRLIMELRRRGLADTAILSAIERVPREDFVPEAFRDQAYEDVALPISSGQTISQPSVVAGMIAALEVGPRMKVLEVGTGSGYQAAVLAHLCRRLYTVERHRGLAKLAEERIKALRLNNVVTQTADGSLGWAGQAPYDRIIVAAAGVGVPEKLIEQLNPDGILVMPVADERGDVEIQKLRNAGSGVSRETIMHARFVPLVSGLPERAQGA